MDSQYKLLSELLSDQAMFITSPKTSLANYWGGHCPPTPPVSTGLHKIPAYIHISLGKSVKYNNVIIFRSDTGVYFSNAWYSR